MSEDEVLLDCLCNFFHWVGLSDKELQPDSEWIPAKGS